MTMDKKHIIDPNNETLRYVKVLNNAPFINPSSEKDNSLFTKSTIQIFHYVISCIINKEDLFSSQCHAEFYHIFLHLNFLNKFLG